MTTSTASSLPINVIVHDDSEDITIEWDEKHPVAAILNLDEWTEADWLEALTRGTEELLVSSETSEG